MKARLRITYAVLMAAFFVLLAASAGEEALRTAPDFTVHECVYADSITLADYSGSPVLLVFYDGGLVTNINTLRYVREWIRRYSGDGLHIIGIHSPSIEPSRVAFNAMEVIGLSGIRTPIALDLENKVFEMYGSPGLPSFVLIQPGGRIAATFAGGQVYADVERAVQEELRRLDPDIILPLITKPIRPWDDPQADLFPATPMIWLGYDAGNLANADSSLIGKFADYSDPRDRINEVVFLNGRWNVGESCIMHSDSLGEEGDHLRVIYRARSVYVLPYFEVGNKPKVYIKQDRSYLDHEAWGKDVMGDQQGRPFIQMQYSIPYQIVDNPSFGLHQLELITGEGDVSFFYLFFEGGVRK